MHDPTLDKPISLLPQETAIGDTDRFVVAAGVNGNGGTKGVPASVVDARYARYFNPQAYGAKGDNSNDDTSAIQLAINAAHAASGGVVYFPSGTYRITSPLTVYSDIEIRGAAMENTVIRQVTINQDGLDGTQVSSLSITDITIQGNSTGSTPGTGTGIGIFLQYGGAGNNPFHNFKNVTVRNFGSDGIKIQTPIVCSFQKVISEFNGGNGFFWYEGGTSCSFQACWARQNSLAGYKFFTSVYQSLVGCASDNNGTNYMVLSAQSILFSGCGSEGALLNTGIYNGFGFYIDNSSVISIEACWIADNRNIGIWVTNGANDISIRAADNTPNASAVYFIQVDNGCVASIYELHNTTGNNLNGTVNIYNDGAGGDTSKVTRIKGGNGTLTLSADTDGGDYNIFGNNGAQVLALYGSGGNSLTLNLLDGKLIVSTSQTPASASDTGVAGTIAWDSSFIYVCVATNTWKRIGIATW